MRAKQIRIIPLIDLRLDKTLPKLHLKDIVEKEI